MLRKINLDAYFVNKNTAVERFEILLSEKEFSKLTDNSLNILKKSNIDHFMERPSATFCNGKYIVWDHFFTRKFYIFTQLTFSLTSSKTWEYQAHELVDSLIENNHEIFLIPPKIKLMYSEETMRCCIVRLIL